MYDILRLESNILDLREEIKVLTEKNELEFPDEVLELSEKLDILINVFI